MLFDLRSRGRRRTIKVVYVTLAFLMGIGLVGFGIGGDVTGGIVDAITERGGGTDTDDRFKKRETALEAKVKANPADHASWAELARVRVQSAEFDSNQNTFTDAGKAKLREADQAWQKYLSLEPEKPDSRVASLMVQAYAGNALANPEKAVVALEIIAEDRPSAGTYSNLAIAAYEAGQTRKGDLAAEKALELTEPDMREQLKATLDQAKAASVTQQITPSVTPSATPKS
jgi:tetratricopeptide (TPR) repeat protein